MAALLAHAAVMATKSKKRDASSQNVYEAFMASVRDSKVWQPEAFFTRAPHRTFEWYVLMLWQELEQAGWDKFEHVSRRANKNTLALVDDAFRALHTLFNSKNLAPRLDGVAFALSDASISQDQYERLAYHLTAKLKAFVAKAKRKDDLYGTYRLVPATKRRSPRERCELPDPAAPAWSSGNRLPSKKVQITCRVDPRIKEKSIRAAADKKVSYSQWLSEAIVRQLLASGYDAVLEKSFRPRHDVDIQQRRPQRPRWALPAPKQSSSASVNRADKIISLRVDPDLALRIDRTRKQEGRSEWFTNAVHNFMRSGDPLPAARTDRPRYSVPVSLTFDPRLFLVISGTIRDSGLTLSEWLRRVAVWYIWAERD